MPENPFATAPPSEPAPTTLSVQTLGTIPQPSATQFVEGLDALPDGNLVEATGAVDGQPSRLMVLASATGRVLRQVDVKGVFAEGLAVVHGLPDRPPSIWLLTWHDQVALHYGTDLALLATVPLTNPTGQGWGICFDGHELITSDGSATLTRRSPATLAVTGAFTVTAAGRPTIGLNELDCADGVVWANQFPTGPGLTTPLNSGNTLFAIDPYTGRAGTAADLAGLQRAEHPGGGDPDAVPNGIAINPDGTAWITGKDWRDLVRVRLTEKMPKSVGAGYHHRGPFALRTFYDV
ncbi:glutaminyl-peptide cyclotransferase [Kutzneria sp. 744]|nr:glutaminyl-peptide cyclotransferase [Kutzneria sp. 744]